MTVSEASHIRVLLKRASEAFERAKIDQPSFEARYLLCHAAGINLTDLLSKTALEPDAVARFEGYVARRIKHEPSAYIVGNVGFWDQTLCVSSDTLIPRPDTEALIEALLYLHLDRSRAFRFLDLGTGTGCLLLAALGEYPEAFGVGCDLSPQAAKLAQTNALRNKLSHQVGFFCGDWAAALDGTFDIIFSNPPYIRRDDISALMPDVANYEPGRALDGGCDGLDAYRQLFLQIPRLLNRDGRAIIEIGIGQRDEVVSLAADHGLNLRLSKNDLGGIARALVFAMA